MIHFFSQHAYLLKPRTIRSQNQEVSVKAVMGNVSGQGLRRRRGPPKTRSREPSRTAPCQMRTWSPELEWRGATQRRPPAALAEDDR